MRKMIVTPSIVTFGIVTFSATAVLLTAWPTAARASPRYLVPGAAAACGARCFDLSSLVLGPNAIQNAYVRGDDGAGARIGQPVNLRRAAGLHPNEDFTGAEVGQLTDYCGAHISARSYPCVHFPGSYPVYESDWSPFGDRTNVSIQGGGFGPCDQRRAGD